MGKDGVAEDDERELARLQRELVKLQEQASLEAIKLQESVGLDILTDGEMRRRGWTDPLTRSLSGYGRAPLIQVNFQGNAERAAQESVQGSGISQGAAPVSMATAVIEKVGKARNLPLEEYNFVKAHSSFPTKVTLPSLALPHRSFPSQPRRRAAIKRSV